MKTTSILWHELASSVWYTSLQCLSTLHPMTSASIHFLQSSLTLVLEYKLLFFLLAFLIGILFLDYHLRFIDYQPLILISKLTCSQLLLAFPVPGDLFMHALLIQLISTLRWNNNNIIIITIIHRWPTIDIFSFPTPFCCDPALQCSLLRQFIRQYWCGSAT